MLVNTVIMWIAAVGCILGGFDRILGNRFGLGEKFEEGVKSMGPLALGMGGLICLAPVLTDVFGPAVSSLFRAVGFDPSVFGAILPNDTGGYALAMGLADTREAGLYSGLIVAAMFGATLTFFIPVGFSMIEKGDNPFYAKGILIGLIAVPFGSVIGGFIAGFGAKTVLINIMPITALVVLICLGLRFLPKAMVKGCEVFGKIIMIICTAGFACAGFESLTHVAIIPGMTDISEAVIIVGQICVVLMGMIPIITLILKFITKPLSEAGKKIGLDSSSSAGVLITLVNPLPVYGMYKDMNERGKVINGAFIVCAGAALGDHLGFTAGVEPEYIFPVVAGKLCGGIISLILAILITAKPRSEKQ